MFIFLNLYLKNDTVYFIRDDIDTMHIFTSSISCKSNIKCSSSILLDTSCTKKNFCLYYVAPIFKIK